MAAPFAIKVIWLDGEEEYLMQGNRLVIFSARSHAESQRDFMLEGMQSAVQSVNVVLAPSDRPVRIDTLPVKRRKTKAKGA